MYGYIKEGTRVWQDFRSFDWPRRYTGVRFKFTEHAPGRYLGVAKGFGEQGTGEYGNGAIFLISGAKS